MWGAAGFGGLQGHGDRGRGQESKAWAVVGCGDTQSVSFWGPPPTALSPWGHRDPQSLTLMGPPEPFPMGPWGAQRLIPIGSPESLSL